MAGTSGPLVGTTLDQLLSDDENRLLDVIDELRSQGVGKLLGEEGLPQLVVCGDQSSGKSSVLEALTRVRFPTKSSVCTTFPTELRLRREPRSQVSCRIRPASSRSTEEKQRLARFQESFDSPDKFPELITAARTCMNENKSADASVFFEDVLEVEIVGPKLAPLTVVDLPGLIHYYNASSGTHDIQLVGSLAEKYMKQENSIILAVVSAHNDLNNQIVLTRVKTVVPNGKRTLGIITKPDELPAGSEKEEEYLEYVRTNPIKFEHGWHVVRNRTYAEQNTSFEERDEKEKGFFGSSNWATLPRREVGLGIDSLRKKLSKMLLGHITLSLPAIVHRLELDLNHSDDQLRKLGDARRTPRELQNYLADISDSFAEYTKDALNGRYHRQSFFGDSLSSEGLEKRLRANIRNLNDQFATEMLEKGHRWHIIQDQGPVNISRGDPDKKHHPNIISKTAFLRDVVDKLAYHERANELPGISNPLLVSSLFQQQSEPWGRIASGHLAAVWGAAKAFLEDLLAHLTDERTCNQLLIHVIDPAMEARRKELDTKLEELLTPHRHHDPLNIDPQFARKIWSIREKRVATSVIEAIRAEFNTTSTTPLPSVDVVLRKIEATNPIVDDKYGSHEIFEAMQAYYEAIILVFINNVASLAVEQCLLAGLAKIFSSATIREMDDERLILIASESQDTLDERERLCVRTKTLQKGLQTIRTIQPGVRSKGFMARVGQIAQSVNVTGKEAPPSSTTSSTTLPIRHPQTNHPTPDGIVTPTPPTTGISSNAGTTPPSKKKGKKKGTGLQLGSPTGSHLSAEDAAESNPFAHLSKTLVGSTDVSLPGKSPSPLSTQSSPGFGAAKSTTPNPPSTSSTSRPFSPGSFGLPPSQSSSQTSPASSLFGSQGKPAEKNVSGGFGNGGLFSASGKGGLFSNGGNGSLFSNGGKGGLFSASNPPRPSDAPGT